MDLIRISLTEENFKNLVSGKEVRVGGEGQIENVRIILQDIGFCKMKEILNNADPLR